MRDLLGVNGNFAADLPPEPTSPDGISEQRFGVGHVTAAAGVLSPVGSPGFGTRPSSSGDKPPGLHPSRRKEHVAVKARNKKNSLVGNRLGPGGIFRARLNEFPREGRVFDSYQGRCPSHPTNQPYPRLSVAIGVRADVLSPMRTVSEIDREWPHSKNRKSTSFADGLKSTHCRARTRNIPACSFKWYPCGNSLHPTPKKNKKRKKKIEAAESPS